MCSDGVLEIGRGVCQGVGCSDGVLEIGRGCVWVWGVVTGCWR